MNNKSLPKIASELSFLQGQFDLPSIAEFIANHQKLREKKLCAKGLFTSDETTFNIAEKIIKSDPKRSQGLNYILQKPNYCTNELGSIKVGLARLEDFPQFQEIYQSQKNCQVLMCVGGPSAQDQALIAAVVPQISAKLDQIIYATRNYLESNVAHSAKQYHIRHANALNADPQLTGHNIIFAVLKRMIFGVKNSEICAADFLKIDVSPTCDPKVLGIYLGNELNAIKQNIRQMAGRLNEHDINRLSALLGKKFATILQQKIGFGFADESLTDISSIHVVFDPKEAKALAAEHENLHRVGIATLELNQEQIADYFGAKNCVYKAYSYPTDNAVVFDTYELSKNYAKHSKIDWRENVEISKILLTQEPSGKVKIAGVVDKNGVFTYVSKLHFSGGYKVDYFYENGKKHCRALRNNSTIATGVSINAIFKKTKKFSAISVINSHWTKIAEDDQHMLVRITAGGNTGSEQYNPAYFLNVIANSRRIFGDNLIGILSTYGCSRSINSKNSTQWSKLAEGLVVSYGKGGTGNTKRHFEALKALHKLGFAKEVRDFCNQETHGLGDEISNMIELSSRDFWSDDTLRSAKHLFAKG